MGRTLLRAFVLGVLLGYSWLSGYYHGTPRCFGGFIPGPYSQCGRWPL